MVVLHLDLLHPHLVLRGLGPWGPSQGAWWRGSDVCKIGDLPVEFPTALQLVTQEASRDLITPLHRV